jgi:hypothetical protein
LPVEAENTPAASPVAGTTTNQDSSASSSGRRVSTPVVVVVALAALTIAGFCGWMALQQSQRRKAAMLVPSNSPLDSGSD